MKKVFLALALVAGLAFTSCKQAEPTPSTTTDSTAVQVDSVQVDSTTVDTTAVK